MLPRYLLFAALTLSTGPLTADEAGITAEMRREDPRLARAVSLRADRLYVGELCELLSGLSGVDVAASDRDGAADPRVIALIRELSVGEMMEALRSLLSYDGAPYLWARSGTAPRYRYTLSRSLGAQRLPSELNARAERAFSEECGLLARMCMLSDDELEDLSKSDGRAANMLKFPRTRAAWRMLAGLPHEQLAAAVRGDIVLKLAVADLPEAGSEFLRLVKAEGQRHELAPEGGVSPASDPAHIQVFRRDDGLLAAPSLMINVGAGAYSYAGGVPLSRRVAHEFTPNWVLPGDAPTDSCEDRVVPRPTHVPEPVSARPLTQRLYELAESCRISILARVQAGAGGRSAPLAPYGRTLARFIEDMGVESGATMRKWRDGTLLLTYGAWYRCEPQQPTWLAEKALRRSLAKQAGMSFLEVAALAAGLTDAQAAVVVDDHPCLSVLTPRAYMAAFSGPLGMQLRSPMGLPITDEVLQWLPVPPDQTETGAGSAVRVVERETVLRRDADGRPQYVEGKGGMWWWEYLGADRKWRPKCGYTRPRELRSERADRPLP